jgi:hypothetical protein
MLSGYLYKPLTVAFFRIFFAANLIGAFPTSLPLWTGESVNRHQKIDVSVPRYRAAPEITAAWIAMIWVMVTVMLWLARRGDQANNS